MGILFLDNLVLMRCVDGLYFGVFMGLCCIELKEEEEEMRVIVVGRKRVNG